MIKYYPLKRNSNIWTCRFISHVFEIIFYNFYVLYKKFNKEKNSHHDFTEKIINYLIEKSQIDKKVKHPKRIYQNLKIILLRLLKDQTVIIAGNFPSKDELASLNVIFVTFICA
ncbi:hypothetical protein DMUE_4580 [Dictyocoela muelleri]|nr:hypothetical protein DMUE_4580 [Dictyocoela muelleri]